ncbi:hypothetical protein [Sphingomonas elodea]|uniref:hypothetical protein n=1 Tax=Sphingomonas elodea TaxID=179878 RepID=UPI0004977269|nr:hypothetical protein [Sphingomonas elodea]
MSGTTGTAGTWCILRTSGGRTVPLARSLTAAGFEVWTPVRTIRRPAPGQGRRLVMGQRRKLIDVDLAILPGFVFARADQLHDLVRAAGAELSPHPAFSVFHQAGRVPLVRDASITGLRAAEDGARELRRAELEAETREEARRARAERMRTESNRRKALRRVSKDLPSRTEVMVEGMQAFDGLVGIVVEGRGSTAIVEFGGSLRIEIEAWQLTPTLLQNGNTRQGVAA